MNFHSDDSVMNVLRLQLAAVKQHFIHVLILQARKDQESAAEISKIDSIDLPNAMQLVDFLVSTKSSFDFCSNQAGLLQTLPNPGFSNAEIRMQELQLEVELGQILSKTITATNSLSPVVRDLVTRSLEPRLVYVNWLHAWSEIPEPDYVLRTSLNEEQSRWLDCLFANMMVMIDQTMVHSFVHWHESNELLANMTWEVCGAAMMQATAITKHLAEHGLAAEPKRSASGAFQVAMHAISADPIRAAQQDKILAAHCVELGLTSAHALAGTEFEQVAYRLASYFEAVVNWSIGEKLPNIPNPCRDFNRVRSLYLDPATPTRNTSNW